MWCWRRRREGRALIVCVAILKMLARRFEESNDVIGMPLQSSHALRSKGMVAILACCLLVVNLRNPTVAVVVLAAGDACAVAIHARWRCVQVLCEGYCHTKGVEAGRRPCTSTAEGVVEHLNAKPVHAELKDLALCRRRRTPPPRHTREYGNLVCTANLAEDGIVKPRLPCDANVCARPHVMLVALEHRAICANNDVMLVNLSTTTAIQKITARTYHCNPSSGIHVLLHHALQSSLTVYEHGFC